MIHRSPFPDIVIPEVSLTSLVLQQATRLAGKPALIDGPTGRTITYAELATRVRRLAIGLARREFGKGDVLAIYSPNVPEYAIAVHGAIAAGGTVTTVNPLATAHELATQLNDAGAVYLVTAPALLPNALQAAACSRVREVFVFGAGDGAMPFDDLLADDGPWPAADIDPREDVAIMPYSSGTTGLPKGVMLTHYNLVANCYQVAGFDVATEEDRIVAFLPFFHIYGIFVFLDLALSVGATIITMPRFDLEGYVQLLQEYRSPRAYVVPPVVLALAKHPIVDRYDLSSLRMIMSAAAPVSPDLCRALSERLGCQVKQAYGMTELSPCSHAIPESDVRVGSGGVVVRNTESKIVDIATGRDLGPNQQGEIWVRGPQVMKGYLNRPEATAETITPEGWLRTGDIGYADDDGCFYIVDRLKELIKYKGYQVAPAELEALLLTHPAIADAAVIPSPDDEVVEVPKAFVVLRHDADPDEILEYVAQRVAPYKKIRRIELIDQIPKSPSGKILRRVLVERERERALAPA
jgi:acyl-CoA synthetase (AMP-forming)/AMP-acid ligase II